MSHYSVAVFSRKGQSVEDLLAPYDENMEVEPYIWLDRQGAIAYAREHYRTEGKTDEECWQMAADGFMTDKAGNIYSTYNPDSKWDCWEIGGSWSGELNKNGERVDSARVGDLSFPYDHTRYNRALRFWDVVVDQKPARPGEKFYNIYRVEYLRKRYLNRETYAMEMAQFATYAVVTPDGKWHACGKMGWFGVSHEKEEEARDWYAHYKERFIDTADKDWILTVCDCHI